MSTKWDAWDSKHQYHFNVGFSSDSWRSHPQWEPRWCEWHYFEVHLLYAAGYLTKFMKPPPCIVFAGYFGLRKACMVTRYKCGLQMWPGPPSLPCGTHRTRFASGSHLTAVRWRLIHSQLNSWAQLHQVGALVQTWALWQRCFHANESSWVSALNLPVLFSLRATGLPRLCSFKQPWLKAAVRMQA